MPRLINRISGDTTSLFVLAVAFLIATSVGWYIQVPFLPVLFLALPVALYFFWQTMIYRWIWVVLIITGSFMGQLGRLADEGILLFTFFQLALFVAMFAITLRRIIERDFEIRLTGFEIELSLFLGFIFLSLMWSPMHMDGFVRALRLLISLFFVYLVFNEIRKQNELIIVFSLTVAVGSILAIISIYDNLSNVDVAVQNILGEGRLMRGRASGTSYDPNIFATMFFIPFAFSSCVVLSKVSTKYRLFAFVGLLLLSGGLIVTYSRSAWVSVIFMLIIIAWYYKNIKLFAYFVAVIMLIIIVFPQFTLILINAAQRFLDIAAGASGDDSSRIRVLLGIAAIRMFIDSYFIGVGFRGYVDKFTDYFSLQESIGVNEPHNVLYTILAELGLIGIVLYLLIFFKIFRAAYRSVLFSETEVEKILSLTCLSTLVAYMIFYQFYGGGLSDNNFWFIIAVTFSVYYSGSYKKPSKQSSVAN